MYLLTNKNNTIVYITTEAVLKSDGIHVGGNLVFSDKTLNIIKIDELPNDIIPQKYCYTNDEGFYLNKSYNSIINEDSIHEKLEYIINKIEPIVDENRLTLEEMKKLQVSRVGRQCKDVIDHGVDVELSTGVEHFSLTMEDQKNIDKLLSRVKEGMAFAPYHSDTTQCKIYSAEDILNISITADTFILYQTTYCNSLNTWIRRCETKEEIRAIQYGIELPEDLANDLDNIITLMYEELQRIQTQL